MLLKNLINNISDNKKNIFISGLSVDSNQVKKIIFFSLSKEINLMEKILSSKQLKMEPLLWYVPINVILKIKKL